MPKPSREPDVLAQAAERIARRVRAAVEAKLRTAVDAGAAALDVHACVEPDTPQGLIAHVDCVAVRAHDPPTWPDGTRYDLRPRRAS